MKRPAERDSSSQFFSTHDRRLRSPQFVAPISRKNTEHGGPSGRGPPEIVESNKKYSASSAMGDEGRPPGASLKEIITKWFSSATSGLSFGGARVRGMRRTWAALKKDE